VNGGKGEAVPVPPIKRMLETYLSSPTRGTFGTRLSARTIYQEGPDARAEQDGDERMVGHWKPYATLLALGLISKAATPLGF
jgi:hypothetical protein